MLDYMAFISAIFNNYCSMGMPDNSAYTFILEGMLCGKNIESTHWRNIFAQTNLLHLFVVSGSHLIFVETIFNKVIPKPKTQVWQFFVMLILFAYLLMTLMQPPVFRAYICLLLKKENSGLGSPLPDHLIVGISGLICLLFFPSWIHSWSLLLSWLAALALANLNTIGEKDFLMSQAWVSSFLMYPLMSLGLPHPIGIFIGSLLLIPLGQWLLPICAVVCLVPVMIPLFDLGLNTLSIVLFQFSEFYPHRQIHIQLSPLDLKLWGYLLILQFISWWICLHTYRKQATKCRY